MDNDVIDQAQEILAQTPLPPDAYQRLEALEKLADDRQRIMFRDIWEGYHVAGGTDP